MVDGNWLTDPTQISFFPFNTINPGMQPLGSQVYFLILITIDEIKGVVWLYGQDKVHGQTGTCLNSSNVIVQNPLFVKDFRPISLIGVQYKIIAKILVLHLVKVEGVIRFALLEISGLYYGVFRVWLEVERVDLFAFMFGSSIGFGSKTGYSLSFFLFNLVMEGLHIAVKDVINSPMIGGISVDDVVFVTEWNHLKVVKLSQVLNEFYLVSWLKLNMQKSNIFRVGVDWSDIQDVASLPIGSNMGRKSSWSSVIDKITSWLSNCIYYVTSKSRYVFLLKVFAHVYRYTTSWRLNLSSRCEGLDVSGRVYSPSWKPRLDE
uniref:Reverse transcriptase domain-containing protein n=1 Tax=Lactuca sativa TaxID=4236 RepID=A0A9R1XLR7_LACSA|nr:hypothetical protein LSAT_V11C300128370 [Lactuca sativa]